MSIRRNTIVGLVTLCTIAGSFLATAGTASAWYTHRYLSQITEVPAEPGVAYPGPFPRLLGLSFQSNHLYVADGNSWPEFDEAGKLVKDIATTVSSNEFPQNIAVNNATGEAYLSIRKDNPGTTLGTLGTIDVIGASGKSIATWEGADTPSKQFRILADVAMDNSTNPVTDPAAGNLYVIDNEEFNGFVDVLRPEAGGKESYVTQLPDPPGGEVHDLAGVAVDEKTGDVAVAGVVGNSGVVDMFKPISSHEYEFLLQISQVPGGRLEQPHYVAIDNSNGDIYVSLENSVDQFSSTGAYLGRLTGTPTETFARAEGLAVGPTGNLYVADDRVDALVGPAVIDEFGPNVAVPSVLTDTSSSIRGRGVVLHGTLNASGTKVTACQFEYGMTTAYGSVAPCSQALPSGNTDTPVSANVTELVPGTTYYYRLSSTDTEGDTVNGVAESFTMPLPSVATAEASGVQGTAVTLNGIVENPYEVPIAECQVEYAKKGEPALTAPCAQSPGSAPGPLAVSAALTGLVGDDSYQYRFAITPEGGEIVYSAYKALFTAPLVDGSAFASNITSFAATLSGVILAAEVTPEYHFAYGTTTAYGSTIPQPDASTSTGGQQPVSQTLTGLRPDTTYHYALVVKNFGGGQSIGPDQTFTTRPLVPPAVNTGGSEAIAQTTATLTGAVNPEGLSTTYHFEYGPTISYGSTWPLVQVFAGTGSTAQGVAVAVPNLQPGAAYHYRLVATNEDGTTYGPDQTFATPAYPVSIVQEPTTLPTIKAPAVKTKKAPAKKTKKKKPTKKKKKKTKQKKK